MCKVLSTGKCTKSTHSLPVTEGYLYKTTLHIYFNTVYMHMIYLVYYFLCGLVIRIPGCRSSGPGSIPGDISIF
jgi:hypothetical protein